MSTPPFVRFYANDWFTGCIGLKADERGVYVSMCVYIWTAGRRVPMDDAEAARMMGLQFNNYQRIRNILLAKGKVKQHDDGYGVTRAEKELDHARNRTATGAATGDGRWSDEAAQGGNAKPTPSTDPVRQGTGERAAPHGALLGTHTPAPQGAPTGTPQGTQAGEAEKTQSFLRATKEPITNNQTNKQVLSCASPELKEAFNGSTENMLTDIGQWMRAERRYAEKWLQSLVSQHGSAKVLDGYAATVRAQAEGRMVADPIRYMSRIAAVSKATAEPAAKPMVPAHVVRYAKPKLEPQPWETN